ncbi:hypothetical protein IQ283_14045 [Alkalihalobacillus hwajinpoensis]|uniref:hypothetical protein n=1 Tax=Guptibacillus hwajinpoensis TaxID=208199 RepID=UPI001884564E|nr:hypothetical protein [Pseudalkalibacillus hwajinpoensis]MBF0707714.1 hypothetical protein [Pseudalkalibacillus hwajinpoensis]
MDSVEWIFSGIGVFILSLLVTKQISKSKKVKQVQKSGKNSINYQATGNMTINSEKKERNPSEAKKWR